MANESNTEDYILGHIDAEGEYLNKLYRATHLQLLYPHMVSGHLQGRILKMLTHMVAPKNVLEIGTYSGYSALCIAEGRHCPPLHVPGGPQRGGLQDHG